MKRRNILLSLAAFPALAVARPLLSPEKLVEPIYTIYFILDDQKGNTTLYWGTKEEIKEQLFRPYRLAYCKGRKVKFLMHKGGLNMNTLDTELKEICNYLEKKTPLSEEVSYKCIRGFGEFKESSVTWLLDAACPILDKKNYNLTNAAIGV